MGPLLFFIRSKMYAIGQPGAGASANALLAALYGGVGDRVSTMVSAYSVASENFHKAS